MPPSAPLHPKVLAYLEYLTAFGAKQPSVQSIAIRTEDLSVEVAFRPTSETVEKTSPPPSPSESQPQSLTPAGESLMTVRSPLVGMFYHRSSPDASAFIIEGSPVTKGQVLGIIEAMKLFHEIRSDVDGRVAQILAPHQTPVEYNQPLVAISVA